MKTLTRRSFLGRCIALSLACGAAAGTGTTSLKFLEAVESAARGLHADSPGHRNDRTG